MQFRHPEMTRRRPGPAIRASFRSRVIDDSPSLRQSNRKTRMLCISTLVMLGALSSCQPDVVVMWTDRAEAAPIVELFNASQDQYVVELKHETDVSRALRISESAADLVIAGSIEDLDTARFFRPLDRLMGKEIESGDFYAPLLSNGARSGRQMLLPLSFNLPLVYFKSSTLGGTEQTTLNPSGMRAAGADFNEMADGIATRLAFSPVWDSAFLYELIRYGGLVVEETESGSPTWSLDTLLAGINLATGWIDQDNGGVSVDDAFSRQYLYDPIIRLVQQDRVLFGFDSSNAYFQRTDEARRHLTFRWFGDEGRILALEPIVYAAITARSPNRRGAEAFLAWLFDPELQIELLSDNRRKRIDTFGVAGGFSSLWRVTERTLPRLYPELSARIPPASWLVFPPPSPRHWIDVVEAVVRPWLLREASGQPQARDLSSSVAAWMLQQEE